MTVFDCDEENQYEALATSTNEMALDQKNLLQSFAPDAVSEATNRGFRSVPAVG